MARNPTAALAGESLAMAEFAQLFANPVYYGVGTKRGDGRHVVVLPGLFGNDWYLYPLRSWLSRIGFRPVRSSLAINAGCPERLTQRIEKELARRLNEKKGPVAFIGHSRGGILARAIAGRLQEQASHLILLGSPVGAIERWTAWPESSSSAANPSVAQAGNRARSLLDPDCDVPRCGCPFPMDLRRPLSPATEVVSIYSESDPVVPPWACTMRGARNIEVAGTHTGLVYNGAVYRELAAALT